jgi:hypothetical protein
MGDMMGKSCFMFSAVIHKDEDMYVAECPEVGTVSQGFTVDEALENKGSYGSLPGRVSC